MQPDVVSRDEELPFADGSFDLVVSPARRAPLRERARRVRRDGEGRSQRGHRRRQQLRRRGARGGGEGARSLARPVLHGRGVARDLCGRGAHPRGGESAAPRGSRSSPGSIARVHRRGRRPCSRARSPTGPWAAGHARADRAEGSAGSGDHRRPGDEARRPGPDRSRGHVPRTAQPRVRHAGRRRRDAGQGRPGRRGCAGLRHRRRRGRRDRREHVDGLRPGAVRHRRRSTRRSTPASPP